MVVGTLGDIPFQVDENTVRTLNNFKWKGSARWAVHERHGGDALTEFTGRDADAITFDIYLSAFLGLNPMKELEKIWAYKRAGTPIPLTIGEHKYGRYRWVIQSHETVAESFLGGDLLTCTVSVSLLEYLKR